ncbi:hypothetical protein A7X93_01570 [Stenotrophomonas maltophilia]|nr:hypothetical protein A7X93_01570 [Stenotrophomonas maltophilia]
MPIRRRLIPTAWSPIGSGAAADGQPWPERHPANGRRMMLADADGALAGLRIVQEVLLAAERCRQNAAPEHHVSDRVMEGLMLASLGLATHAAERLQPV